MKAILPVFVVSLVFSILTLHVNGQNQAVKDKLSKDNSVQSFTFNKSLQTVNFIDFKQDNAPQEKDLKGIFANYFNDGKNGIETFLVNSTTTRSGIVVERYKQKVQGIVVEHSSVVVNKKAGSILSLTSEVYNIGSGASSKTALSEEAALVNALAFVNAEEYAWQALEKDANSVSAKNPQLAAKLRTIAAENAPKGTLVYSKDVYGDGGAKLAWKFNIYATNPLSHNDIYIDAATGKLLLSNAIIKHADKINASAEAFKKKQAENAANNCAEEATAPAAAPLSQLTIPQANEAARASVMGTALTRYSGTREIYTTQLVVPITGTTDPNNTSATLTYSGIDPRVAVVNATVYILKDDTRGDGMETYDMNAVGGAPISLPALHATSLAFVDKNNVWANETAIGTQEDLIRGATSNGSVGSDEATNDDYAIDAFWGSEMVYDYWKVIHGRLSYDNKNAAIKSYVHYGPAYDNAFWNGSVMTYGDGSGTSAAGFKPLTSLDVCGHEIGHGVCSFTSDLVYASESGALNEALSDIWSAAVENFVNTPPLNFGIAYEPFQIGEQIESGGVGLRRMDNPKVYSDPDTYGGQHWKNPICTPNLANDQCGVHSNSGVLNKYFYLLVKGPLKTTGSPIPFTDDGKADNGAAINAGNIYGGLGTSIPAGEFNGIGFAKAEQITYLMELNLTPNATFADARVAAINAARLLYGQCSIEEKNVTNAFFAVNVGPRFGSCSAPPLDVNLIATSIEEGVGENNCVRYKDYLINANLPVAQGTTTTINITATGGTLGTNEYQLLNAPIVYAAGQTGAKAAKLRIFDDAMLEANETLNLSFTSTFTGFSKNVSLTINENDISPVIGGNQTLLNETFEGVTTSRTVPAGWGRIDKTTPRTVEWGVETQALGSPLIWTGKRAIIEQVIAPPLPDLYTGRATYDQLVSAQTILKTPLIDATGLANVNVKFTYSVGGEPACSPNCDYGQLVYSIDGTNFSSIPGTASITFAAQLTDAMANLDLPPNFNNSKFYLGFLWYNDPNAGTSASFTLDNVIVTAQGKNIETVLSSTVSEPISNESEKVSYFYSNADKDIIAAVTSHTVHNYGCMNTTVEKAGTSSFVLFNQSGSPNYDHVVGDKVISMVPATNNAAGEYTVSLYYTEAEILGIESGAGALRNNLKIYKVTGAPYTGATMGNTIILPATYTAVQGGGTFSARFTTGFSSFAVGNPVVVLPISLTSFNGSVINCGSALNWKSGVESDAAYYEVQRADASGNYMAIAKVNAKGSDQSYTYTDNQAAKGTNQYRLRMVDANGSYKYSDVVLLSNACRNIVLAPTLTANTTRITGLNGGESIQVYNAAGQLVQKIHTISSIQDINLSKMAKGIYNVIVSDNNNIIFKSKVVLQ